MSLFLSTHYTRIVSLVLAVAATDVLAQWSATQYLVDAEFFPQQIKNGRIAPAGGGGFHILYGLYGAPYRYRRFQNGALGPAVTAVPNFSFNCDVAESATGEIHLIFESWDEPGNEVGWVRSTNGGTSFTPMLRISNASTGAKWPFITRYGTGGGPDMLMAYMDSDEKRMKYQRWNGSGWSPASAQNFATCDTEYQATGIGRSPIDGSVYRTYGREINDLWSVCFRRYNGSSWDNEVVVSNEPEFYAWPYIAVNNAGVIMVFWEGNEKSLSRWFTPNVGWSERKLVDDKGIHGHMAVVPGTNHFVCCSTGNQNSVQVRLWVNGLWLPAVNVSDSSGFTPDSKIAGGEDRSIMVIWENWDLGRPMWKYSLLNQPLAIVSPISLARTVNIGQNLSNDAFVATNGASGTLNYTLAENAPWLSVTPDNGSSTGEDDVISVVYDVASLHRGVYNTSITMNSAHGAKSVAVQVTVVSVRPDFDGDGDVDQSDFGHIQACYSGSAVPQTLPACLNARLDGDEDVDLNDFGIFQGCISGAGVIANPNCAG